MEDPERLGNFTRSLALVLKDCKHRKVRYLLVTPEIESGKSALNEIASLGLQKRFRKVPYGSARLSLEQPIEKIFQNLNGKWRNMLRKAQKMQLNIEQKDIDLTDFRKFVEYYKQMQVQKGFVGISENLLGSIFLQKGQSWKFNLFQSDYHSISGKDFAGFLISVQHGDTATYVIGHTNQYGRKTNANYLMLWHSIIAAQKQGCRWFDLGGINKNSAPGVVHFKNGLNAEGYTLIGEFSKFRFF